MNLFVSEKYFCTDESVKRQITDSVSENSTNSVLESGLSNYYTHFVFVSRMRSSNIDNTHISIFR